MREVIIFLFLFLAVFAVLLFIFNGRYIYAQIKYAILGAPANYPTDQINGEEELSRIPQRLLIPVIGVDAPIVLPENSDESALLADLEKGVVLWPNSVFLGEKGTMVILGHSSAYPWYKGNYGSIFSLLSKLKESDEIFVYSAQKKYTYRVVGTEINLPESLNLEKQEKEPVLYLLSCWPINTNWKRIAVKAILD